MSTDNQDWLKFQLTGKETPVSAEAFVDAFHDTIEVLKSIDKGLSTYGSETIQWQIVDAGSSSPVFAKISGKSLSANNGHGREVIDAFLSGMDQLSRSNNCPPHFNKDSLKYTQDLIGKAKAHGLRPKFSSPTYEITIRSRVAKNASWAMKTLTLHKSKVLEYGTLEGYLKELNVTRGHDKLVIVDVLTDEEIVCSLSLEHPELEDYVRTAWKKRVAVTGEITINRTDKKPTRIAIDDIKILRERKELPQIEDLHGIDITGGVEPSEYIRGIRDAE
jgi:hypothetical protein